MNLEEDGTFLFSCKLLEGRYLFKFIVDGVWKAAPNLPHHTDSKGYENNFVDVGDEIHMFTKQDEMPIGLASTSPATAPAFVLSASDGEAIEAAARATAAEEFCATNEVSKISEPNISLPAGPPCQHKLGDNKEGEDESTPMLATDDKDQVCCCVD